MAVRTLGDLLAPLGTETFLKQHYGREFLHCEGSPGKFTSLMPWSGVNDILRHHQLRSPRLRIFKNGSALPEKLYTEEDGESISPGRLQQQLDEGATLIIDSVDQLYEPITALAEDLEFHFRSRVQVNMYAVWRSEPGFDLHWDKHDVIVVQVTGRKHWKVYSHSREWPLADDVERSKTPPESPIWEGTLAAGEMLYIPRGWWHAAVPADEPTVHLTIGLHQPKGVDFLKWYVDRLRTEVSVRRDLPIVESEEAKAEYLAEIRNLLTSAWSDDLLTEYLETYSYARRSRPRFRLPVVGAPAANFGDLTKCTITWNSSFPSIIKDGPETGTMEVRCSGKNWVFSDVCRPVVQLLQRKRVCSLAEIAGLASEALNPPTIRAFTLQMITKGIVRVDSSADSNGAREAAYARSAAPG